jgi:hypothetical protein
MKHLIRSLIIIVVLSSCNQEVAPELVYSDYILAGETIYHRTEGIHFTDLGPGSKNLDNNNYSSDYSGYYSLDVNNDEVLDYKFEFEYILSNNSIKAIVTLEPLNNNEIIGSIANLEYLSPITLLDTINAQDNWTNQKCIIHDITYTTTDSTKTGLFLLPDQRDEYIGVKTNISDTQSYGWIRISKTLGEGIWIYDFATTVGY